jgi:hypothetical protein
MKLLPIRPGARGREGYILATTMLFTAIGFLILADVMSYTTVNGALSQRNNQLYDSELAAEAATEKVLTKVTADFQSGGESLVYSRLSNYGTNYPTSAENPYWSKFQFSDAQGHNNATYVARLAPSVYTNLDAQYTGLMGVAAVYRVVANASEIGMAASIQRGVKQDVQVATIPAFQFAIFYNQDMEINPGPVMNVTGRVHSNANLYTQPQAPETFYSDVTAVQQIILGKDPLDPTVRTPSTTTFDGAHDSKVTTISLPIGTNNTPSAVQAILQPPPAGESPSSAMGQLRYYNQADLVVMITNNVTSASSVLTNIVSGHPVYTTNVTFSTNILINATSGLANNFATPVPAGEISKFIITNSFYNAREAATIQSIDLNVGQLISWSATNSDIRSAIGRDVNLVYLDDQRPMPAGFESGIRVTNGQTLPPLGLTVATPNPMYVAGNFNAPNAYLGTTNTSTTLPSSLVGDAITILSSSWKDSNSTLGLNSGSRNATATTVNAAILAGNVPSNGSYYSGGVENFPRFLENWAGVTITYNGSMVMMFPSAKATGPWGGANVYNPPNRNWAFNLNYLDPTKLPPGTPQFRTLIRAAWTSAAPNNVN